MTPEPVRYVWAKGIHRSMWAGCNIKLKSDAESNTHWAISEAAL